MIAKLALGAIWSLAGAILIRLMALWDQLPPRVAVHFGVAMQANGWSSRTVMAVLMVLVVVGHSALATWLIVRFPGQNQMMAAIQMTVAVVLVSAFWQVISFNAQGKPFQAVWILVPVLLMLGLVAVLLTGGSVRHSAH